MSVPSYAVIIAAAGKSSRFRDKNYKKPFIPIANRAVWLHSVERFTNRSDVKQCILVISPEDQEDFTLKFGANVAILGLEVVDGGKERADSVRNGLEKVRDDIDYVVIHDAARPCIADEWIDAVFEAGAKTGAAILASPITSTLKRSKNNEIQETVPRENLWAAQTPQVFRKDWLLEAFAKHGSAAFTDESQLLEKAGHKVTIVPNSPINIKITTREDLRIAEQMLKVMPKPKNLGPLNPFADDDMWR
jgi:2-C-methyl-D-erythritol 4-phosphate cytidylyltransferase